MPTRVSTAQIFHNSKENVLNAKEKEASSAEKSGSLKALQRPSEAPAEWVIASNLKDDISVRDNLAHGASLATHVLTATENILSQAQDITQKIQELAISAANGDILGNNVSKHTLPEVQGLYENFIQALNTKFGNRAVLGGFKSDRLPFDVQGNYFGDDGKMEIEIDRGLKVPINLNAKEVVYGEGQVDGINIIQNFQTLIQGLAQNDKDLIRAALPGLTTTTNQLSLARTKIAGSMQQMERAINAHGLNNIESKDAASKIAEADPVKVFSDLARDQTVLRAAMDTSHKLLTGSSVDVLFK